MARNGMRIGSERCCLCGRAVISYHNPDPVRGAEEDCCDVCNHLIVIAARRRMSDQPDAQRQAYAGQLAKMSYDELLAHFSVQDEA